MRSQLTTVCTLIAVLGICVAAHGLLTVCLGLRCGDAGPAAWRPGEEKRTLKPTDRHLCASRQARTPWIRQPAPARRAAAVDARRVRCVSGPESYHPLPLSRGFLKNGDGKTVSRPVFPFAVGEGAVAAVVLQELCQRDASLSVVLTGALSGWRIIDGRTYGSHLQC